MRQTLDKMALNFSSNKIREYTDNRGGQLCRDGTFGTQGPKLFNCLPSELRARGDMEDPKLLEKFKRKLDTFLATIVDKPRLPS